MRARLTEAKAAPTLRGASQIAKSASDGARRIVRAGSQAVASVDAVADKRMDMAAPQRLFMLQNGVNRPARKPKPIKTMLTLQACGAVEAVGTSVLLVGDGTMSLLAGLLTGTVFSSINIALGVLTGFGPLRGIAYRNDAPEPKRGDRLIRRISMVTTVAAGTVMALMHFAAARVRVTGDHADILNFEKVSFFATFSDYSALALLVLGGLSSSLAIREGWGQLTDPIFGYSRITQETEGCIRDALNEAYDDGSEYLETAFDSAAETLETLHEAHEEARETYCAELRALRREVGHFNSEVKLAVSELKALQARENKQRGYLEGMGRDYEPVSFDLAALRQLAIDDALIPDSDLPPCDLTLPMARLEEAFEEASGKLWAAHTTASNFTTPAFSEGRKPRAEASS